MNKVWTSNLLWVLSFYLISKLHKPWEDYVHNISKTSNKNRKNYIFQGILIEDNLRIQCENNYNKCFAIMSIQIWYFINQK